MPTASRRPPRAVAAFSRCDWAMPLALLLLSATPACRCQRSAPDQAPADAPGLRLVGLDVVNAAGPAALPGVSSAAVRGWTIAELHRARHLLLLSKGTADGDQSDDAHRLRIRIARSIDEQGDPLGLISITAHRRTPSDDLALQSTVGFEIGTQAALEQLKIALRQAIADVDFQAALAFGPPQRLLAVLEGEKDAQRLFTAIDIAALRRTPGAAALLVPLLKHQDERVADRAIGALVAIGDRAAVKPLTRLAKFEDTEKLAKLIDGIAALGGAEARSYLEFVAGGHPDPDIRDLASDAVRRMLASRVADAGRSAQ